MVDLNNLPSWPASPGDCPDGSHSSGTTQFNGETWFRLGSPGEIITNCDMWKLVEFYKDFMQLSDTAWYNWGQYKDYYTIQFSLIAWFVYRLKALSDPRILSMYNPRYKISSNDMNQLQSQYPFNWDAMMNYGANGSNDAFTSAYNDYVAANPGWEPGIIRGGMIWPPFTSSVTTDVTINNGQTQTVSGSAILSVTVHFIIGGGGAGGFGTESQNGQAGGSGGTGGWIASQTINLSNTTSLNFVSGVGGNPNAKNGTDSYITDNNGNRIISVTGGGGGNDGQCTSAGASNCIGGQGGAAGQPNGVAGTQGVIGPSAKSKDSNGAGPAGPDMSLSDGYFGGVAGHGGTSGGNTTGNNATGYGAGGAGGGFTDRAAPYIWYGGNGAPGFIYATVSYVP